MQVSLIALSTMLAVTAPAAGAPSEPITREDCLITLIDEAQVPAQEPGVLIEMQTPELDETGKQVYRQDADGQLVPQYVEVRPGLQVREGDLLARIDDTRAKMQHRVAEFKLEVAQEEANNDIHIRYSTKSAEVAEAEYHQAESIKKSIAMWELRRLHLKWQEAFLSIEQAETTQRIAKLNAKVSQAEVEAAGENLQRRSIKSPLDGVVVAVHSHVGEWVQPGDAVLHVVRMNRLYVETYLNANQVNPNEVDGRRVSVVVKLARGQTESLQGRIVFASPQLVAGGDFNVRAEVENRLVNGRWLLGPGRNATMTIHFK